MTDFDAPTVISLPRRESRDATTREPRRIPAHEAALFHGALLQITSLDAKLAIARQALEQIASRRELPVAVTAVAVGALTKIGAGTAPTATVSPPPGGGPLFHSETSA